MAHRLSPILFALENYQLVYFCSILQSKKRIDYSLFNQRFKKLWEFNDIMKVQQLICDQCKIVLLEKDSKHLNDERFPITEEEAKMIDKDHREHECHIELVEKFA